MPKLQIELELPERLSLHFGTDDAADLRKLGWTVSVHNDYRLQGEANTFWLLSKEMGDGTLISLTGEAQTDGDALDEIRMQIEKLWQKAHDGEPSSG